ncbi:MAG: hypothetical protein OEY38_14725 [Gammaproteobacteria bacterium]|nr:hypothetical protein [Gammaproteobacteria bacterium]
MLHRVFILTSTIIFFGFACVTAFAGDWRSDMPIEHLKLDTAPTLFGHILSRPIVRSNFRLLIRQYGVSPIQEDDRFWADEYDSSEILKDSTTLRVGYTKSHELAVIEYIFPDLVSTQRTTDVIDRLERKYGIADSKKGLQSLGPLEYKWHRGGIDIILARSWPITNVILAYRKPRIYGRLMQELNSNDQTIDQHIDQRDEGLL